MKIERLIRNAADHPLVRLFDFTPAEADALRKGVRSLADRELDRFDLAQIGATSVDNFVLSFAVGQHDLGLLSQGKQFVWLLQPESWDQVEGLIEPFAIGATGFQQLSESGETVLLLSSDGCW